jgi:hydroxymethylglutaryl-CoA reductase
MTTSRLPGFRRASIRERRIELARLFGLSEAAFDALDPEALSLELADKLIENVVGIVGLPVGIGLNLVVNGSEVLVPMAVEEASVVAAFSHAAKLARAGGGFSAEADPPHMIGQIQLCPSSAAGADEIVARLAAGEAELVASAREACASMESRGGGLIRIETRRLEDHEGGPPMVVLHLVVDVVDAMGANAVNAIAEQVAPVVSRVAGTFVHLRVLSNLAVHRLARARCSIPLDAVGGAEVAERIAEADRFARIDPYRAATHNKGILNGIDAVAVATGNDWRAIEAAAHAYAARDGCYRGLTRWTVATDRLAGSIELPMPVGIVGGLTKSHPTVALLSSLMGVESARMLAAILAAVGLAQNLAALRALSAEGIQRGHMTLHARQLAIAAGASPDEVDAVVRRALEGGRPSAESVARALEIERSSKR